MDNKRLSLAFLLSLILAGTIVRVIYLVRMPVCGDSAVFILMARHIAQGKEFPIYMWLNHYAGALPSYIAAVLFKIFGMSLTVFFSVGVAFSFLWALLTTLLSKKILPAAGYLAAAALVFLPPREVLWYSFFDIHVASLLWGILILSLLIMTDTRKPGAMILLGFSSGVALWHTPGIAPCLLTVLTVLFMRDRKTLFLKHIFLFIIPFLIGFSPGIIYSVQYPGATLFRMGGRILNLDRATFTGSPHPAALIADRILWRVSTIPHSMLRLPILTLHLTGWLMSLTFFISLAFLCKVSFTSARKDGNTGPMRVILIFIFWFVIFYSVLVGEDRSRYVLPLYVAVPVVIGFFLSRIWRRSSFFYMLIFAALLVNNGYGIGHSLIRAKALHYGELTRWLLSKNISYGYSDYDTAYSIMVFSGEKVIVSPTIFDPAFSDRRPSWTAEVRQSGDPAYIVNRVTYPEAARDLEDQLRSSGVTCERDEIGEFVVYKDFSRKVYPENFRFRHAR